MYCESRCGITRDAEGICRVIPLVCVRDTCVRTLQDTGYSCNADVGFRGLRLAALSARWCPSAQSVSHRRVSARRWSGAVAVFVVTDEYSRTDYSTGENRPQWHW